MDTRPALPVAVDNDVNRVYLDSRTGEKIRAYNLTYTEYDWGRILAGYCCIHCGEAQIRNGLPEAFPERCSACMFPMREKQAERIAEEFEGPTTIGPTRSIAELRAEDDEVKERARREREGKPTSSIWVPSRG